MFRPQELARAVWRGNGYRESPAVFSPCSPCFSGATKHRRGCKSQPVIPYKVALSPTPPTSLLPAGDTGSVWAAPGVGAWGHMAGGRYALGLWQRKGPREGELLTTWPLLSPFSVGQGGWPEFLEPAVVWSPSPFRVGVPPPSYQTPTWPAGSVCPGHLWGPGPGLAASWALPVLPARAPLLGYRCCWGLQGLLPAARLPPPRPAG